MANNNNNLPIEDNPGEILPNPGSPNPGSSASIGVKYTDKYGETLTKDGSKNLGSFVKGTSHSFSVYVYNSASESFSTLVIPKSGIAITDGSSGSLQNNPSNEGPINLISDGDGLYLTIDIDASVVGNKSVVLKITSSDPSIPLFVYTFFFTITEPIVQNPSIALVYNSTQVLQNSVVSLGGYPQDGSDDIVFQIFNYAVPALVIPQNGISITTIGSNETLSLNPSDASSVSLNFNESSTFNVHLDTSSIGNKSAVIVITSNDPTENPFVFTISYTVSKPFDLVVKEASVEVESGDTVSLGSFNNKTIINRNISLSNSGISYGIRLLSIIAEGDATLQGVPSLPYVLQPNSANTVQFVAKFGSSVLGKRNASLNIQWEVTS